MTFVLPFAIKIEFTHCTFVMENLVYHNSCIVYSIIYEFLDLITINQASTIKSGIESVGIRKGNVNFSFSHKSCKFLCVLFCF